MENNTDDKQQPSTAPAEQQAPAAEAKPEQPAKPEKPPKPSPPPKQEKPLKTSGSGKGLALFSLLLAVIAIAGCVYLWMINNQQQQMAGKSQADMAGAIQRVDQQDQANRELQRQLDRQQDSTAQLTQQLQQNIDNLQRQLASQNKRLLSMSATDRDDWLLAEAEYLMRLANQRLLMGKEVQGALDLLQSADGIFIELDDSGLYAVRQALANDMAALRAAGRTDLEGLYFKLAALANQTDRLRLIKMPELTVAKPADDMANEQQAWQQRLQSGFISAWHKLRSYIQINRRDEVYKPLLAPEYEAAVRQNVRLMFEQAQMATLSGKQRLYENSLAKAKRWLNNYYTLDQSSTETITASVDELAKQTVEIILPDISGSLRALKTYLNNVHELKPANNSPAAAQQETEE